MSKILGKTTKIVTAFSLLLTSILSMAISPIAGATSTYDSFIQTMSTLTIKTHNSACSTDDSRDITNSWNSLTREVLIGKGGVYATTWLDAFDNKVDWVIYQHDVTAGSSAGARWIDIYWTDQDQGSYTEFSTWGDPYLVTWANDDHNNPIPFYRMSLKSSSEVFNYGCDSGSDPLWSDNFAHDNTSYVTSDNFLNTEGHIRSIFASTPPATYPSGYEGVSVPSYLKPQAVVGNVQCEAANSVTNVRIDSSSGFDGNARLTDDGIGGKNYHFPLWSTAPYSLIVTCDDEPFYSPTIDTSLYQFYNWACVEIGEDNMNGCVAS